MKFNLDNGKVSVAVKQYGAELSSFKSDETGTEYLWQGNPDVWYGQSPILFPIVGTLNSDTYRVNGKEYVLHRHGIARKRDFELKEQTDNSLTLTQSYNDESLKSYPYKYVMDVKFALDGKKLTVSHTVKNADDKDMYFSIGGHPGFNCEIGDYLEFEENETLKCEKITPDALLDGKLYPTLVDEKTIEITKNIFDDDALILSGMKSDTIYLRSNNHANYIKFNFGKAPYLGLWAKPGASYVCIEPWYGINDNHEVTPDFSQKRDIQKLAPGAEFVFTWSAEICE